MTIEYIETPDYCICAYALKRATRKPYRVSFRWKPGGLPTMQKYATEAEALAQVQTILREVVA